MSNIYIQEPPALGKVLLKTSAGEIDIELWTKEAPKACRNFIQLCMEGYYNGTIFHRVVPGFIVQGGDPNGDGTGGESIYGEPFKDEFHSRLRFNRRGLVASANAGKDDNGSQFFFTLAATPELQNKHTIFGKVTGETIYNVLKLSEGLIGPDDRPDHPHKITSTVVVINPFTDIEPRVRETREEERPKKKKKERQGVKNFGLLSFGEEAEEDEGEAQEYRGKPKSTHDLLEDPKLSNKTAAELELEEQQQQNTEQSQEQIEEKMKETAAAVTSIRDKLTKKRGKSPDGDSKRQKTENNKRTEHSKKHKSEDSKSNKKQSEDQEEGDSDSSIEEYYIGKEKDDARKKEKERIQDEIKQLRKEMKNAKEEKIKEQSAKEESKDVKKAEEDNEMYKKYVEEQEKYRKMKDKLPKKGAARNGRQKPTRMIIRRKPWVKNLYENREYPDNHTDGRFLQELRKNLNVEKVTLPEAIQGSFRVVLRLCICIIYAIIFVYMYNDWVHTYTVIYTSIIATLLSYILYITFEGSAILRHLKTVLVYVTIGYLLSPVLHTLTDTVSTDTIYAWAVIMMVIHLIFFDYNVPAALVSNSLSINAAIFASVCLVSRLSTPFDAFVLLTISVILFVLSPQLFKSCLHTKFFNFLFFVALFLTVVGLYSVSMTLLLYFLVVVVILSGYCPFLFVHWQKYKDNKYGPWDEAVINDSDDLEDCLYVR